MRTLLTHEINLCQWRHARVSFMLHNLKVQLQNAYTPNSFSHIVRLSDRIPSLWTFHIRCVCARRTHVSSSRVLRLDVIVRRSDQERRMHVFTVGCNTYTAPQRWANLKSNLTLKSQMFFNRDPNLQAKCQILSRISHQNLESSNSKSQNQMSNPETTKRL